MSFLSIRQAIAKPVTREKTAETLGVSVRTVDRYIAEGILLARKYKRAVRIDGASLQQYLASTWKNHNGDTH